MAEFNNTVHASIVTGTAEADLIINSGNSVTVNALGGDDTVRSTGERVSINGGAGNNFLSTFAYGYGSVVAGTGNDTVYFDNSELAGTEYHGYVNISGGNNYIANPVELSTIQTGAGNDTIITGGGKGINGHYNAYNDGYRDNTNWYASIVAGDGDNRITVKSYMSGGKISAGTGKDFVSINGGAGNGISVGSGDDTVVALNNTSTINVGAGKNLVTLKGDSSGTSVLAGKDNDYVYMESSATGNYLQLGNGVNTVYGLGRSQTVITGTGDDLVTVGSGNINAGEGKNKVSLNEGGNSNVTTGASDDTIIVDEENELAGQQYHDNINAGDGNNYINNANVELSTIQTGAGNDTIITGGGTGKNNHYDAYNIWRDNTNWYASIMAGAGDNRIVVNTAMTQGRISAKDGNDSVVTANSSNSTINVGNGNNFVTISGSGSGNNVVAGKGDDLISLASSSTSNAISVGSGNNTVIAEGKSQNVWAGDDDNLITVGSGYINVGDGKNNISLGSSGYSSVIAGNGDDTLNIGEPELSGTQYHNRISMSGGNNYINNAAELSTIQTGAGNDTIITGGGTGKDNHWDAYDIWRDNTNWYASIMAGAGDNRITVNSYMSNGTVTAGGGADLVSIESAANSLIDVGNGRNTIVANNNQNSGNTFTTGTGSDLILASGKNNFINAGSGRNGISLAGGQNNTIVTGKGNDTVTLGEDASNNVIVFGEGNDLVVNYQSGDTIKTLGTVALATVGADIILIYGKSKMTLQGAAGKSINTAELSANDTAYKILIANATVGDTAMPDSSFAVNPGETLPVALNVDNTANSMLIEGTELNDTIQNSGAKVTIAGNESDDTIINSGKSVLFKYANGDGNDLITGFNATSTLQIGGGKGSYSTATVDNDIIVTVGDGTITLQGAASLSAAKISGVYTDPLLVTGTSKADAIKNMLDGATITALGGKDTVRNYGDAVSIDGGTANDNIRNYGDSAQILGNTGSDNIRNYGDDTTVNGGEGNDTIRNYAEEILISYAAGDGNDVIYGFNETSTLQISGGVHETAIDGNDLIVTVGEGTITLKDAADFKPAINNPAVLTLDDGAAAKVTLASGIVVGDASERTKAIRIVGNSSDNSILGGAGKDSLYGGKGEDYLAGGAGNDKIQGQNGNDTLWGGVGNDTLTGGAGVDTFIYNGGEGKDVISDFGDDDLLQITGDWSATYSASKKTIAFKIDSTASALTLKNFTAATFNINGDAYTVSGTKLVK